MTRYITAAWWEDPNASDYLAKTVYEPEPQPVKTGILDKNGTMLYRVEQRDPIGFIRPHANVQRD